jgi:23S rRNA (cytidine1920-2'-O)/16S rRNA (cytidine1409-2'-O)-methyltransferase
MAAVRKRLDTVLVERGLYESRSKAAAAVVAGDVLVGEGRARAEKPGMAVDPEVGLAVREPARYVSRGGLKLERALDEFGLGVSARQCLDAGASTGGFTDCLLQRGAAHVVALDVAYGELHWSLRQDERVTVLERTNARSIEAAALPYRPQVIVADLSFIGLGKVLPALAAVAADAFDLVALVKPQFELDPQRVGKGGVVRSAEDRLQALVGAGAAALGAGMRVQGFCSSGLPGPAGNRESFIWCTEAARPSVADLTAAALVAEPEAGGIAVRS